MTEKFKPRKSQLKQQRLPAWQPILSPPHVTACFFLIAVIFIPIGVAILLANKKVHDMEYTYSNIRNCTATNNDGLFRYEEGNQSLGCFVKVSFTLSEDISGPVFLYYKLTNFYQNHRRFAKSRSDKQLSGAAVEKKDLSDCKPLRSPGELSNSDSDEIEIDGKKVSMVYNPAGLVAWSMFNDSFLLYKKNDAGEKTLLCNGSDFSKGNGSAPGNTNMTCRKEGIAWESDRKTKFKAPNMGINQWTAPRWHYGQNYPETNNTFFLNGWYLNESGHEVPTTTDEDFMVWMRTASLPTFRKLYRVFDNGLSKGEYEMHILEQFDVSSFDGAKAFVLATTSWAGGKNDFMGYAYVVVGGAVLLAGIVFIVLHKKCGDRSQKAIEELMNEMK